jgi:cation transport ATPase
LTAPPHPSVKTRPGSLEVTDDRVFGPGGKVLARRFAGRVLGFDEVRSLALAPSRATATVNYRAASGDLQGFLTRLADAVAGSTADLSETELPHWTEGETVVLHRYAGIITIFEELNVANGCLTAHHPAMASNPVVARRVENALRVAPGVIQVIATRELRVRFDPNTVAALQLVRIAEKEILGVETICSVPSPEPVNFALENVTVGIAAVGSVGLPLAAPVATGLLVLAALGSAGVAALQLRQRKIGLPMLYTCAVGTRVASGQFLAASLLSWLFRYWEYRYRQDVEVESRSFTDESAALPRQAHVLAADGSVRLLPRAEVAAGQQVRVLVGEHVPVDGRVLAGAALVDEGLLGGQPHPVRRLTGDPVLAGTRLLAGGLEIEALRTGDDTRAVQIVNTLIETTLPPAHPEALNRDAGDFAGQAVAPTLLAGAAGLAVADMTTAAAILSPDYATGVGLAVPLERTRAVKSAFRLGAVIRAGNALERLATTSWIVLDEHEALHHAGCEVAEVRTKRLEEVQLLPAIAAAGAWLGDERGPALARACRGRGLVVRRAELRDVDGDGVTIRFGDRLVRLRGRPVVAAVSAPPLMIEVDGVEEAGVRFRRNGSLNATTAIRQLQRDGVHVFLASERPADAAAILARRLGVNRHLGEMTRGDKNRLFQELEQQCVAAAHVGDCSAEAPIAREAHLSIALAGADADLLGSGGAEIVLIGSSIAPLPALFALARRSTKRVQRTLQTALVPNLLSVAGAFVFEFTAMASVIISNLGTGAVYHRAKRSLLEAERARPSAGWGAGKDDYASHAAESSKWRRSA